MLQDNHQRVISYLRISVTDRCNFRCVYCMPADGIALSPRDELLSFEEIARVARVGASLGLSKIRLTGGEPTVRRDLPHLVSLLRQIDGIREITMTTNAARLGEMARPLKDAGLDRVNISIDSLKPDRMAAIARRDVYDDVMNGIEASSEVGLKPKFNAVIMRGTNEDEVCDLLGFANRYNAQMRFIEYMPMGQARFDQANQTVSSDEIRALLSERFDLVPVGAMAQGNDPARGWQCRETGARVGFISSMSDHFCASCNRMRLTAEGELRPCLHQNAGSDVRQVLRNGGPDEQIAEVFRDAAGLKWSGHRMNDIIPLFSAREMVSIGG